ncbi:MAG: drug/metabolite exporter YedA [Rhodanobacteraceae bacterium]|jgi:drug/metabolite transporter (DMT)-like permease|nr:drug/metabolite exporter YedA [Rhodanobacteraceae bacterium]
MPTSSSDTPTAAAPALRADARLLVPLALLALYFVWGSTYLAIRVGLSSYPPFLMASVRFLCAGGALYAFLRWRGMAAPTRMQWANSAVTGTLLLGLGNGLVCYAEQSVASGLAAVAVAAMPLFAAVFGGLYGQWPRRMEWLGLGVGFAGVVLLNLGGSMTGAPLGALALVVAAGSWAFGSVWSRRRNMPPAAMNTAAQMLTGGAVLLVFALLTGERWPAAPTLSASLAVAYLAVAGSLVGFSAYLYLLNTVRPALATSYAYVNPPVAVLVGALFAGEAVHPLDLVAMAVILAGVGLIAFAREREN